MAGQRPDFICIGAPKSGTSWLYDQLVAQPDVFLPAEKGTNYFDRAYDRGPDWYASRFASAPLGAIRGEISHDYYSHPDAAARIAADLPDVKLICILREPGDFIRSNISWLVAHTKAYGDGVAGIWANPEIKANTRYLEALLRFQSHFSDDQVLILFYEDLRADPDAFLARICAFIGAARPAPIKTSAPVNPTRAARSGLMMRLVFAAARRTRDMGLGGVVEAAKRNRHIDALLYSRKRPALSEANRTLLDQIQAEVRAYNSPHFDQIAGIAGSALPAEWRDRAG